MNVRNLISAAVIVLSSTGGVASASTDAPALRAPAGPSGWVVDPQPGTITIVPFSRTAPAAIISVTPAQAVSCVYLDVYPGCLSQP